MAIAIGERPPDFELPGDRRRETRALSGGDARRPSSTGPATTAPTRSPGTTACSTWTATTPTAASASWRSTPTTPSATRPTPSRRWSSASRARGSGRTPTCTTRARRSPAPGVPRRRPHVFVLDAELRLRYHGAPDADYEDASHAAAWVREALDAVLEGREPERTQTPAVGCGVKWEHDAAAPPLRVRGRRVTARRRLVRVPASSANLGPGYDVLAAALAMHLELEVEETGTFSVEAEGLDVPLDRSNLCVRAFEWLRPADEIAFRIRSDIPLAAGLGSSAAAIVAGLMAADHLYELALESADLLSHAAEIEGHADNVAAAHPRRLRGLLARGRRRHGHPPRPPRGRRGGRGDPRQSRCRPRRRARRSPGRWRWTTRSPTSPPPRSSCWASSARTWA